MEAPKEMQSGKGNMLMPLYDSTHTLLEILTHTKGHHSVLTKASAETRHTYTMEEWAQRNLHSHKHTAN